jgi:ribosomal-protein-alanine N-acetyltransferase
MTPASSAASPHLPASVPSSSARFVRLDRTCHEPFVRFLADLRANGDQAFFHPHGFDVEAARAVIRLAEEGPDEYWLLTAGVDVLGYGMLRGWAEGYAVPSLGLAVAPRHRGRGLARALMHHLHGRARDRGACQVRLKVDRRNLTAHRLYESLGYVLQDHSQTDLLGLIALAHHSKVDVGL